MIDPTPQEQSAMQSCLKPLGECVAEIGMHRPLQDYTRAEALTLIEVVVSAYQDTLCVDRGETEKLLNDRIRY